MGHIFHFEHRLKLKYTTLGMVANICIYVYIFMFVIPVKYSRIIYIYKLPLDNIYYSDVLFVWLTRVCTKCYA